MTCDPCLCFLCPCTHLTALRSLGGGILSLLRDWRDAFFRLG